MAVLKDLIVHGASRFLGDTYFNFLKANDIAADTGYFKKLTAVEGTIDDLTSTNLTTKNATVTALLDVQGEMHTNSWSNANIATIDGSFYINPTSASGDGSDVSAANYTPTGTITYNNSNYTKLEITGTFNTSQLSLDTASNVAWPANSYVIVTGDVLVENEWYPLGTIRGKLQSQLAANSNSKTITVVPIGATIISGEVGASSLTDGHGLKPQTLEAIRLAAPTAVAASPTTLKMRKIKVSMTSYGGTYQSPIGIYMTAMGGNKKTFLDIYGGKNDTTTIPSGSGALAEPTVRIGNLEGMPATSGVTPHGWGIYTNNGFFTGTIVARQGKIGDGTAAWTIGNDSNSGAAYIYTGTQGSNSSAYLSTGYGTVSIADSGALSGTKWAFTAGANFGVTTDGTLYAKDAQISGNVAATQGFTVTSAAANGITLASMTTNGITLGDATAANNKFNILITDSAVSDKGPGILLRKGTNVLNEITADGMKLYLPADQINTIAEFGETIILGDKNSSHINLSNNSFSLYDGAPVEVLSIKPSGETITRMVTRTHSMFFGTYYNASSKSQTLTDDFTTVTRATFEFYSRYGPTQKVSISTDGNGTRIIVYTNSEHNAYTNITFNLSYTASTNTLTLTSNSNAPSFGVQVHLDTVTGTIDIDSPALYIGAEDTSLIEVDYHSFQMLEKDGSQYFSISTAVKDGYFTENFKGDGETTRFYLLERVNTTITVTIDNVATSAYSTGSAPGQTYIVFDEAPSSGQIIQITYEPTINLLKKLHTFTFGSRGVASQPGQIDKEGSTSMVMGRDCMASGDVAYAEGVNTMANGSASHAEGDRTITNSFASHAEGCRTITNGIYAHAEGWNSRANGVSSHAEGGDPYYSMANVASGMSSHAEGAGTEALNKGSHAEGYFIEVDDGSSVSFIKTTSDGVGSHAEGVGTTAHGTGSHAEGNTTEARGNSSHAEGYETTANGNMSHAEGQSTTASGSMSHAEGWDTIASGVASHAQNEGTIAQRRCQTAIGSYNVADTKNSNGTYMGNYSFIIGNGTSNNRSNTLTVDWNGKVNLITNTSIATNDYSELNFSVKQTDNNITSSGYIRVYDDKDAQSAGTNMVISPGSGLFIGGGEAAQNHYNLKTTNTLENIYMTADTDIFIQANGQTIANRVGLQVSTGHGILPCVADVATNNVGYLGSSQYRWAGLYVGGINASGTMNVGGSITANSHCNFKYITTDIKVDKNGLSPSGTSTPTTEMRHIGCYDKNDEWLGCFEFKSSEENTIGWRAIVHNWNSGASTPAYTGYKGITCDVARDGTTTWQVLPADSFRTAIGLDKYTRSSAGHIDWSTQADGDSKVIMKSALAYWNGRYNSTGSNLKYSANGVIIGTTNLSSSGNNHTGISISANAGKTSTFTVTRSGYYPICIDRINLGGTGSDKICVNKWGVTARSDGSVTYDISYYNPTSTAYSSITIAVYVLWAKL